MERRQSVVRIMPVRIAAWSRPQPCLCEDLDPVSGDTVVLETSQGEEYGVCCGMLSEIDEESLPQEDLPSILRFADETDRQHYLENLKEEKKALRICREKVEEHKLSMVLTEAHYLLDRRRLIFYFTADGRIDFRELVKDLASIFRMRIELRQIGVRDEARMKGGLGICGRELCCSSFLRDFQPVSIKMAKEQNLSMNPSKISGLCGRLLCCLKYEEEAYEDALRRLPKVGDWVKTPAGSGEVAAVDLLKERVSVRFEDGEESSVRDFPGDEIRAFRDDKEDELQRSAQKKRRAPRGKANSEE